MKKVLVIGSTNVDLVEKCNRFPARGETVIGQSFNMYLGGKGANQAVATTYTGVNTTFLTCIGNDSNGKFALDELNKLGVNVKPIYKKENTGTAIILVEEETGENQIIINGDANTAFSCEDVDKNVDLIKESDYILLQLEIPLDTIRHIVKLAKKYNKEVILNPAPFVKLDDDILENITYITPNEGELAKLADGNDSFLDNANKLLDKKVKNIIVTLGSKGSIFVDKNRQIKIDSMKQKAIDTTGAGDCYNGTFVGFLAQGYNIEDSLKIASIASGLSVTRQGAAKSYFKKEEILNIYNK